MTETKKRKSSRTNIGTGKISVGEGTKINIGAGSTAVVVGGLGIAGYLIYRAMFLSKESFEISMPVASPKLISVDESTTISVNIKSNSKTNEDVDVVIGVYEAGNIAAGKGKLINEYKITKTIKPGETITISTEHKGTLGGQSNNGIAMRVVGIGTWIAGKEIGAGRLEADIFGVNVGGEAIRFAINLPVTEPHEVILNQNVNITASVTSACSRPQNIAIGIEVKQQVKGGFWLGTWWASGNPLGYGEEVIGTPYKSSIMPIQPGETKTVTYTGYKAIGTPDIGRTVGVLVFIADKVVDSEPFGDNFHVVSKLAGTDIIFGNLSVRSSITIPTIGYPTEIYGKTAIFDVEFTNNSPFNLEMVNTSFRIGLETIPGANTYSFIPPNTTTKWSFPWKATGNEEAKYGTLIIRSNDVEIARHDYGNVIYVVVPKILTLYADGPGTVAFYNDSNNQIYPFDVNGEMGFQTNQSLTLKALPSEGYRFDRYTGDVLTEGDPMVLFMDRNRTVTVHFVPKLPSDPDIPSQPANNISFGITLFNPMSDTYYWRVEHFDSNHISDFYSEFKRPSETVPYVYPVSSSGNIGIARADSSGNILSTWYSSPGKIGSVIRDGEQFDFNDSTEVLTSRGV